MLLARTKERRKESTIRSKYILIKCNALMDLKKTRSYKVIVRV